jgi:hypothetical protein
VERLLDQEFVRVRAVDVGGVNQADVGVDDTSQHPDRVVVIWVRPKWAALLASRLTQGDREMSNSNLLPLQLMPFTATDCCTLRAWRMGLGPQKNSRVGHLHLTLDLREGLLLR